MKKLFVIILAVAFVALPSCKNQKKAAEAPVQKELSQKEKYVLAELELNANELAESFKQIKMPKFMKVENGEVLLSEKEKMVKPDYLVDPSKTNDFVTLDQKYRGYGIMNFDCFIAEAYGMPVDEYKAALQKLLADMSDPAIEEFIENSDEDYGEAYKAMYQAEVSAQRLPLFWSMEAAWLVEQIYVLTKDVDKVMQLFDDETASDISYHFILVHNGLTQLVDIYPEMAALNAALQPLYVINAINCEQLRDQLLELKGSIETVRAFLLQ